MTIALKASDLEAIRHHGEETFPHECCGFILGTSEKDGKIAVELASADNAREEEAKHHRFLISPENFMETEKRAREKSLDIIGFYHSHPNAEARPSTYDRDHAWPWYSYLIVSVDSEGAQKTTSWVLNEDRSGFEEEIIICAD